MAVTPYKFQERRSSYGWSNNSLIEAATQTDKRKTVPLTDVDTFRNISPLGRRTLLATSRWLYENFPIIKGAIQEQARLAVETFIPQFEGKDEAWGDAAEDWLQETGKYIDIAGDPHNYETFKRNLVISSMRDGALGVVLTETQDGLPQIQPIPCHRVGNSGYSSETSVQYPAEFIRPDGRVIDNDGNELGNAAWQGFRIVDGVILNVFGKRVAHRLIPDQGVSGVYRDISMNDFAFRFLPDYLDQVREIPPLAVAAFSMLDVSNSAQNELFAQLINSMYAIQEYTEDGNIDTVQGLFASPASVPDTTTGAATSIATEQIQPGIIQRFKAGSGQKIESMVNERPSVNVMSFQAELIRRAFCGIGWSSDFSVDPSKVGGAQMRIVIEKINAKLREIQSFIVAPMLHRIDSWRIAKAMKLDLLPFNKDWFKWSYQGPEELTADLKYSSDVALQEFERGPGTLRRWSAMRNGYWKDDIKQKVIERKFLEDEAAKLGVDPDKVFIPPPGSPQPPQAATAQVQVGETT